MLTFFYVDAFNLYFGSSRGTPSKWLDLAKLMESVFPRNQVGTFARRHWQRANSHPRCRTARARSQSQRSGDRFMTPRRLRLPAGGRGRQRRGSTARHSGNGEQPQNGCATYTPL